MIDTVSTIKIEGIYVSPGHDFFGRYGMGRKSHEVHSLETVKCVAGRGLEGDRFFDFKKDHKGQVTFFASEVADTLREKLAEPYFDISDFRRNIITRGIDLNGLIGKRFRIGSIEFEGTEESKPCEWMDEAVGPGAKDLLQGNGGLRARIISSGTLNVGELNLQIA